MIEKIIEEIRHEINMIVARNIGMDKFDVDNIKLIEINRILDDIGEKYNK